MSYRLTIVKLIMSPFYGRVLRDYAATTRMFWIIKVTLSWTLINELCWLSKYNVGKGRIDCANHLREFSLSLSKVRNLGVLNENNSSIQK